MNRFFKSAASLAALLTVGLASTANAAVIGNWDGSSRSWNQGSTLVALMQSRGHTVEADGGISAAGLAGDTLFVIGEATRATTVQETADLSAWISGGGRLLVTVDSSNSGASAGNAILSALGSSLSFGGSAVNGVLQSGNFLTDGGPFSIAGSSLVTTAGTGVSGGTSLAGSYVAVETFGSGYIFGFGDHFTHNYFNNSASNVNGQMHINLVESLTVDQPDTNPNAVPIPASIALLGGAIAGAGIFARKKAAA